MASVVASSPDTRGIAQSHMLPAPITCTPQLQSYHHSGHKVHNCGSQATQPKNPSQHDLLKLLGKIKTRSNNQVNSYPPITKNCEPTIPIPTSASANSLPSALSLPPSKPELLNDPAHLSQLLSPIGGLDYNGNKRTVSQCQHLSPTLKFKRSNSLPAKKRSVVFADTIGEPLVRVRIISVCPDDPPNLFVGAQVKTRQFGTLSKESSGYGSDEVSNDEDDGLDEAGKGRSERELASDSIFGGTSDYLGGLHGSRDMEGLIRLINALKVGKKGQDTNKRHQSYPIEIQKALPRKSRTASAMTFEQRRADFKSPHKFTPCFSQPATSTSLLMSRLQCYNASLQSATLIDNKFRGTVLCKNIDFHKEITIKFTIDNWQSFTECRAKWRRSNLDCSHDIFEFDTVVPELPAGPATLVFCIRYNTSGAEYWDSNDAKNYIFQRFN